ncbi:MAG: CpsD/CapB family tyrosine-protein kinase [Gammaproteobacteria bacterium]
MNSPELLDLNLAPTILESQVTALLVVAPHEGNGATTTTLSLAQALIGHLGESVLVIDGNLKAPALHAMFALPLSPGFRTCMEHDDSPGRYIHRIARENLDVMAAGEVTVTCTASELREKMRAAFASLSGSYRYILFDGMAVQTHPEVLVMAPVFDGVILVLESEVTTWSLGAAVKDKLERADARLIGAILNKRQLYVPKRIYDAW